jgi:predicted short-subunit dehydrogenase-like oxidoreductase (DUF2520 family)
MDIVFIGSGNVASVLGQKFKAAGHDIVQIISRNASVASKLAYEWDTESANYISLLNKNADIYIIAVPDDAIEKVAAEIKLPGKVIAHTAASVSKEVLKGVSQHYGVFYPLQSLSEQNSQLPDIPIFFDGSDTVAKNKLKQLADSISSGTSAIADDEMRLKLHVAAVVVNNFVNHLYDLAEDYCKKEGIDFTQLLPLIDETSQRIKKMSPHNAQTGPAVRHDKETLQKHLEILKDHPVLKNIYVLLTESIQQMK